MGTLSTPFDNAEPAGLKTLWRLAARVFRLSKPEAEPALPDDGITATPNCRKAFMRAAGMGVATFMAIATQDLPPITEKEIKRRAGERDGVFTIIYKGDGFEDEYRLNLNGGTIGPGYLKSDLRDRRTGRYMFALRAVAGLVLNMKEMEIVASLSTGAHTWARAGIEMDKHTNDTFKENTQRRLDLIRDRLDDETIATVERLIKFENDTDLADLANLPLRLEHIGQVWSKIRRKEQHGHTLKEYISDGHLKDRSMTLGQYMLFGQYFDGIVRLNDAQQISRIERFSGVPIRELASRQHQQQLAA